jgi:hypothetical protein
MELSTIQTEGTWNEVAEALNDNFSKIGVAIESGTGSGGEGGSVSEEFKEQVDKNTSNISDNKKKINQLQNQVTALNSSESTTGSVRNLIKSALQGYVPKEDGKGLSTEDFTTTLKDKLSNLENYDDTDISNAVNKKQDQLIDNYNIKTINGQSILGEGNLLISSGDGGGTLYLELDVSPFTAGYGFEITEAQMSTIRMHRSGSVVFVRDVNRSYEESEWGQITSCYRQYMGSSTYAYRVSIIHKTNAPLSTNDNAKVYNIDIMDYPQSGNYSCTVTSINNLY